MIYLLIIFWLYWIFGSREWKRKMECLKISLSASPPDMRSPPYMTNCSAQEYRWQKPAFARYVRKRYEWISYSLRWWIIPRAYANQIGFVWFNEISIQSWSVSSDILKLLTLDCQTSDIRNRFEIASDLRRLWDFRVTRSCMKLGVLHWHRSLSVLKSKFWPSHVSPTISRLQMAHLTGKVWVVSGFDVFIQEYQIDWIHKLQSRENCNTPESCFRALGWCRQLSSGNLAEKEGISSIFRVTTFHPSNTGATNVGESLLKGAIV
jgi:hypothetical protein